MKLLPASCQAGVVTLEGIPHPQAKLLTAGVGASEGVVILQDDEPPVYIPKASPDLNTTLEKLIAALGKLTDALGKVATGMEKTSDGLAKAATVLQALDTKGFLIGATGGVPAPPASATDIAAINTAKSGLDTAKGDLNTLKGDITTIKGQLETLKGNLQ